MDRREKVQQRGLKLLNKHHHGIIKYAMRTGKSKIIIDFINLHSDKKFLWSTPKAKSRDEDIPKEFEKWDCNDDNCDIICHLSLSKVNHNKYDYIILDEIQLVSEAQWESLGTYNNNIIGITGTLPKDRIKKYFIELNNLKVLTELSIDEAASKDIIADYEINILYLDLNTEKNIDVNTKKTKFKTSEKEQYDYWDRKYKQNFKNKGKPNKFLAIKRKNSLTNTKSKLTLTKKLFNKNERTLIFCPRISQANEFKYNYHSKTNDKDYKDFIDEKVNHLAVVKMANTSLTFPNMDKGIILQADNNNIGNFDQRIGRVLMPRENYTAQIWVLVYESTVDEKWVKNSIKNFDNNKINTYKYDRETNKINRRD